jgi:RNA-splicing ligase RtcB
MTQAMTSYPTIAVTPVAREIPVTARGDMRVPVRIYADDELWRQIANDQSLEQAVNVATLPGVTGYVYAMPDVHEGYGFPVGGVAATRVADRVISPGGVGYDINGGVRLLASELEDHGGERLCVHRKGATRAFGPAHPETPERYRAVGQPVFIPGSMGTASYVLAGTDAGLALSFGSTCHGAGRAMSRGEAKRTVGVIKG